MNKWIKLERVRGNSADIMLYCLSTKDGSVQWKRTVKGEMPSGYNYGFSDSTTPCPATDGKHVWAINSSGGMACFTMDGKEVWQRTWMPTGGRPFNKQFDSILIGDALLNIEPPEADDKSRIQKWNYLRAIDKNSGNTEWVCKDALTHYNTPLPGVTADGKAAVLIARGGPHGVPERPVGLSLVNMSNENQGSILWRWEAPGDNKDSGFGA
ncbi:MAG: serine/threonine protein kinase related protein, partial [Lentisphaeraceae bacterium]|nr:serine/threonine protein kinase related protein [Lentisphaeraceae bacterium]